MSNSSVKRKAFTNGVIGFYTGKMQSVTYSKSAGELTANQNDEKVVPTEKSATLNLRVNPQVKESAELVLNQLGIPMSTAVTMYLNQIALTGGIPFAVTLPKAPASINADMMSDEALVNKLECGITNAEQGHVHDAK